MIYSGKATTIQTYGIGTPSVEVDGTGETFDILIGGSDYYASEAELTPDEARTLLAEIIDWLARR